MLHGGLPSQLNVIVVPKQGIPSSTDNVTVSNRAFPTIADGFPIGLPADLSR